MKTKGLRLSLATAFLSRDITYFRELCCPQLDIKLKLNKTVLKQFWNWFVSFSFQWADSFICGSHKFTRVRLKIQRISSYRTRTASADLVYHLCKLLASTNSYRRHRLNDYCRHGAVVKTPACPMHSATHRQYKVRDAGCCVTSLLGSQWARLQQLTMKASLTLVSQTSLILGIFCSAASARYYKRSTYCIQISKSDSNDM